MPPDRWAEVGLREGLLGRGGGARPRAVPRRPARRAVPRPRARAPAAGVGRVDSTSRATAPTATEVVAVRDRAAASPARSSRRSSAPRRGSPATTVRGPRPSTATRTRRSGSPRCSRPATSRPRCRWTGSRPATATRRPPAGGAARARDRPPARVPAADLRGPRRAVDGGDGAGGAPTRTRRAAGRPPGALAPAARSSAHGRPAPSGRRDRLALALEPRSRDPPPGRAVEPSGSTLRRPRPRPPTDALSATVAAPIPVPTPSGTARPAAGRRAAVGARPPGRRRQRRAHALLGIAPGRLLGRSVMEAFLDARLEAALDAVPVGGVGERGAPGRAREPRPLVVRRDRAGRRRARRRPRGRHRAPPAPADPHRVHRQPRATSCGRRCRRSACSPRRSPARRRPRTSPRG